MATNLRPMPVVVIEPCPSDDDVVRPPAARRIRRSCSLNNSSSIYKDLHGAIHHSSSTSRFEAILFRSRSYPPNCSSRFFFVEPTGKSSLLQSPSTSFNFNFNSLDPNAALGGTQTPGGSSSRYSLYGSFFDVSDCGATFSPTGNERIEPKWLSCAGRPLLIVDQSSPNTFQDKCLDWLRQVKSNTN